MGVHFRPGTCVRLGYEFPERYTIRQDGWSGAFRTPSVLNLRVDLLDEWVCYG
jgi:hypothetical protein